MTETFKYARRVVTNDGNVSVIQLDFKAEAIDQVRVFVGNPGVFELTRGIHYTVDNVGSDSIDVNISAPGAWGAYSRYAVLVEYPVEQDVDVDAGGQLGKRFEDAVDRLAVVMQSLFDKVQRSLKMPVTSPVEADNELSPDPGKLIGWNDDGTAIVSSGVSGEELIDAADRAERARDIAEGYASDAVSQGNVPIYGTVAGAPGLSIPDGINAFRLNGYDTVGDQGGWPFAVEVAEDGSPLQPWQLWTNYGSRRWELRPPEVDAAMFGAQPYATAAENSAAINAAIRFQNYRGGGIVKLVKPGEYLLANSNPYPAASYPGLSELAANWWANRRAVWLPYDDVTLDLGNGVTLKVGDGENCHAIQIGQFTLGMSGAGPAIPSVSVNRVGVTGSGWAIDMNGANQNPATDTKDHPAGIIVNHGSERVIIGGGRIFDSAYYGIGFEGTEGDALKGFRKCYVHDMVIEDCKADGFDAKDFGTVSADNVMSRVTVHNCGNGGGVYLTGQAGIDTRGGWTVEDCTVYCDDGFTGERVGFRSQYAPDYAQSADPTHFVRCRAVGNGRANAGTIGFRLTGRNARADDCVATDFSEGFRVSAPRHMLRGCTGRSCGTAIRFFTDAGAVWDADNSIARDCLVEACDNGWRIDAGVSSVQIDGGLMTGTTVPLTDAGSSTHIKGVAGFRTSARPSVAVPVGTTGIKTVVVAHGLPITPTLADIQVTWQKASVSDFIATLMVVSVDATNVTVEANVSVASASTSNSALARVDVDAMR